MTLDKAEIALENDLDFANKLNEAIYALENRSSIEYKKSDIVKAVKLTIRELRTIDREINPTAIFNTIASTLMVIEKRAEKGDFLSIIIAFDANKD